LHAERSISVFNVTQGSGTINPFGEMTVEVEFYPKYGIGQYCQPFIIKLGAEKFSVEFIGSCTQNHSSEISIQTPKKNFTSVTKPMEVQRDLEVDLKTDSICSITANMSQMHLSENSLAGSTGVAATLHFGEGNIMTRNFTSLRFCNGGSVPLILNIQLSSNMQNHGKLKSSSAFFIPKKSITLQPRNYILFPIAFCPKTVGYHEDHLSVSCNGLKSWINVKGTGI